MKANIPSSNLPRIVVIGGGFGGLSFLKKIKQGKFQLVLIDRQNYHTFQPLLYQVATGGLEPDSIAYPLRRLFKNYQNFYFRMTEVLQIHPDINQLETSIGVVNYDYLVIATGSKTNFFGMESVQKFAMPMKTVPEAVDLRSLILQNFEEALLTTDTEKREELMNMVIVGGGPTGVELAGAIGELKQNILPKDYPDLDVRKMQIHLLEATPRLLSGMSQDASKKSLQFLNDLGITVWLNAAVLGYDGKVVEFYQNKSIRTATLIWTAGVVGATVKGLKENCIVRGNRWKTDEFNRVNDYENIFAIGDVAAMNSGKYPNGHPMVAQVAMQQGTHLAENIFRLTNQKPLVPFQYNDKGSMATIGRNRAVVDLHRFRFQGLLAWFVWMFVHLIALVGFRNKLMVLVGWVWSYFNYDKALRLIIRPFRKPMQN